MKAPNALVLVVSVLLAACSGAAPDISASPQPSAVPEVVLGSILETGVLTPSATLEPTVDPNPNSSPVPAVTPIPDPSTPVPVRMAELVYQTTGGTWWTFDDCERDYLTGTVKRIIDVLQRYEVTKVTFFMNGSCYEKRPNLVALIRNSSFEIGNHARDHIALSKLPSMGAVVDQIKGGPPGAKVFRPPFWDAAPMVRSAAVRAGYSRIVMASVNAGDSSESNTCPVILRNLGRPGPTSIVAMHMTNRDTPKALEAYFSGQGCQ